MRVEFIKHIYFRLPIILRLLISVFLLMTLFGTVIHFVEPEEFPTIFDGVWWAFVTGATVGYGDYVPLTVTGKAIGILLILSGGGLLTFYITTFSAETIKHENNLSKGMITYKGNDHIIIVGWNERTRQLVNMIRSRDKLIEIVLIDNSLTRLPYQQIPVHFIYGDASEDEILQKANISDAKSVLVTSDTSKKEKHADYHTVLTTVAIRGNNKEIPLVAEVLSDKQMDNAYRAGATIIVRPNDLLSSLLYHELYFTRTTDPIDLITNLLENQQVIKKTLPSDLEEKSFISGVNHFLAGHQLLLGVIRMDEWILNPSPDFLLNSGDTVITISAWND
ncbi:potassium channel protein [Virgibacillus phasianinus]|uniref:Potassium channel protein n=1 Tax=Virgibacillus phasianinus TaxID=2017483 RepID=A0A220U4G5_9BACI|nr:potassium channel family protein [Virgibacillus phasianinus]ASK62882.1 potassium channel protein [Virgibacillus phasianinus]